MSRGVTVIIRFIVIYGDTSRGLVDDLEKNESHEIFRPLKLSTI